MSCAGDDAEGSDERSGAHEHCGSAAGRGAAERRRAVDGAGARRHRPPRGAASAAAAGARPGSVGRRVEPGRAGRLPGCGHGGVDRRGGDGAVGAPASWPGYLRRAAELLALGADPAVAWSAPPGLPPNSLDPQTDALLRLARRSSASGAALAEGVAELAVAVPPGRRTCGRAAAERAAVLIAGPLGLCFLPAFVCLGIVPVVAGLAGDVTAVGLVVKAPRALPRMTKEGHMKLINMFRVLKARVTLLAVDEAGMSTVEYAIGTIAAAAFAAILYTVVTGDSIVTALTNIIARALNTKA